jgi:uncharacterized Zn finger protein (UPF0148 family)
MICPECGSMNVEEIDRGYYFCLDCGAEFYQEVEDFLEDEGSPIEGIFDEELEEEEMFYEGYEEYEEYPEEEEF